LLLEDESLFGQKANIAAKKKGPPQAASCSLAVASTTASTQPKKLRRHGTFRE